MAQPQLTRELLHAAVQPPNNCKVKQLLDKMDEDQRAVLNEALGYNARDLPARRIMHLLTESGYPEGDVPGIDAIQAHRNGQKPCRCKG